MSRPPFPKGDPRARTAGRKGGEVTAVQRRAAKEPWRGSIIDLMEHAGMGGEEWLPWRAFWKAVYALPMTTAELEVYRKHTKRESPPSAPVDEAWMCIGRGAGKTRNAALHAVFRAITFDSSTVAAGESVTIPLLASDRDQASAALKYVRGFNALPVVAPYVHRGTLAQRCEYRTGVDVQITTASFKAPRGRTSPTACCDEIAFWNDEGSNPDHEILLAIRGTLGRVAGSLLLVLSNPYAPRGELHKAVEQYFGRDAESAEDGVLVWNASTLAMRPSHPARPIARLFKSDAVKAGSEYGLDGYVSFRQGEQALFDEEPLNAAIITARRELPPTPSVRYVGFIDAAQGSRSGDSMCLGIAHREGAKAVLDLVREVQPPFSPGAIIVDTFAPILEAYGLREVIGDRHSVGFVAEGFAACGIRFVPSVHTKSELYAELLPLVTTGMVELLDLPTLRGQLLALQRRSIRGGKDSIDVPRGGHDDVANVAAGALVHVTGVGVKKRKRVVFSDMRRPARRDPHDEMLALIASTKARLEREAERDWERVRAADDAPMISRPIWHVHSS